MNRAQQYLRWVAAAWFAVAVCGQLLFAAYILTFYGGAAFVGDLARWNEQLSPGYVPGNTFSNTVVAGHLIFALLITLAGPLQLIPFVRRVAPKFHRWNGRLYVLLTALGGLTGLYMIWAHQTHEESVSNLAMTLESILILFAGTMVWQNAVKRNFVSHERWAVRLFLVASGVWFFRVFLMFWLIINGGPVGFDPATFTGPFLDVLSFAHYLLPLAVYEGYLWAKPKGSVAVYGMTVVMTVCIVVTLVGAFGATMGMWFPGE